MRFVAFAAAFPDEWGKPILLFLTDAPPASNKFPAGAVVLLSYDDTAGRTIGTIDTIGTTRLSRWTLSRPRPFIPGCRRFPETSLCWKSTTGILAKVGEGHQDDEV